MFNNKKPFIQVTEDSDELPKDAEFQFEILRQFMEQEERFDFTPEKYEIYVYNNIGLCQFYRLSPETLIEDHRKAYEIMQYELSEENKNIN